MIRARDEDHVMLARACESAEWPLPLKAIELNTPHLGTMTLHFDAAEFPPHNGAFIRMPMSLGVNDPALGWFDGDGSTRDDKKKAVEIRLDAVRHKLDRAIAVYRKKAEAA